MTDNEEAQYKLTIGHLATLDNPMSAVEDVELMNTGTQAAILNCLTRDQMVGVLAAIGEEVAQHGN